MAQTHRSWDDYFIPGTSVLRNKVHATTQDVLTHREESLTSLRLRQLFREPIQGRFDYDHMKAIHRHIFQDVYEWAGEERTAPTGPMSKTYPDVVNHAIGDPNAPLRTYSYYPAGPQLEVDANKQYALIKDANYFRGMNQQDFTHNLAESWNELNVIHSFREGNTRSQFAFFTQLAEQAGYRIDSTRFANGQDLRQEFIAARFYGQATGRSDRLATVLDKAIAPITPTQSRYAGLSEATRMAIAEQIKARTAGTSSRPYRPGPTQSGPSLGR